MSSALTEERKQLIADVVESTVRDPVKEAVEESIQEAIQEAMEETDGSRTGSGGYGIVGALVLIGAGVALGYALRSRSASEGDETGFE